MRILELGVVIFCNWFRRHCKAKILKQSLPNQFAKYISLNDEITLPRTWLRIGRRSKMPLLFR